MASISTPDVVNLFKRVYGNLQDILPEDFLLAKDIPFSAKQKIGESYVEAIVLTFESGFTLGGSNQTAFEINPAIAGAVQQATVESSSTVLASIVPWGVISRSAGGGERAFFDATKHVVKNNLRSHGKLQEILRWYGQAAAKLGYVSYASATYRGQGFTNGGGTLDGVTFTAGVNTTSKHILLAPGNFASGIWIGSEGVIVQQIATATSTVVAEGKLVSVNSANGFIEVDFTPVAATSTTSHTLSFKGQNSSLDMLGINNIMSNSTTLFGISTSDFSLWKGNTVALGDVKFTLERLQTGIANAVNVGGLEGDLECYVNPRTWATLVTTESGLREYDASYKSEKAQNGFKAIEFFAQNGKVTINAHRMIKEGEAYCLHLPDWSRSGSAEISFTVPGIDREVIFPLENQAGYAFRSYSDQYMFCHAPARSIIFTGINDESTS
jgi:hypothetical protein